MTASRWFLILMLAFLAFSASCLAQPADQICFMSTPPASPAVGRGGTYMTATGNVRVLVVFVQFHNDTDQPDNYYWQPDHPPSFMNSFIDASPTEHSTSGNLTHFYREMSFDKLILYGDPYFVILDNDIATYTSQYGYNTFFYSNRDALQKIHDTQGVNFALYDNWTFSTDGSGHSPGADGAVDMIIMYYRNLPYPQNTFGIAVVLNTNLTLDGKTIRASFPGSGITNNGGTQGTSLYSVRHEIAHYLLGYDDPYNPHPVVSNTGNNEAMYGLLMRWATFANAHDRYILGWQELDEVSTNKPATFADYVTAGVASRIRIPGSTEAFMLENHQQLSIFDIPCNGRVGKGLFIYRIDDTTKRLPNYDMAVAEGKYNWTNPYWTWPDFFQGYVPVYHRGIANRNGYDGRDGLPASDGSYWEDFLEDQNGTPIHVDRHMGDPKDAFTISYNQVFSPWSNPNSNRGDDSATTIAAEVTGKSTGQSGEDIYNVDLKVANPIDASPSKPQNLTVSVVGGTGVGHPKLTWNANLESDISSYKIYRTWGVAGQYSSIASVSSSTTSYIDYAITVGSYDTAYYKVAAVDNTSKESVRSDAVWIRSNTQRKIGTGEDAEEALPSDFALLPCYPNPFNPSTNIQFTLPSDAHATLRVFDILGNEVAFLANGQFQAGYHTVTWNAQNAASGLYFARLTVVNELGKTVYTKTNKLLLTR